MKRVKVYALIVAGGKGARLKSPQPKQYLLLAGVPILTRTLQAVGACDRIECIILVVPPADIAFCRKAIIPPAGLNNNVHVIAGGSRRQDSVYNGLAAIEEYDSIVAIHDGVRPARHARDHRGLRGRGSGVRSLHSRSRCLGNPGRRF